MWARLLQHLRAHRAVAPALPAPALRALRSVKPAVAAAAVPRQLELNFRAPAAPRRGAGNG